MAVPLIEKALVIIGIDDPDLIKNWRGLHRSHQNEFVVFWEELARNLSRIKLSIPLKYFRGSQGHVGRGTDWRASRT
jgi:hypothetical protein